MHVQTRRSLSSPSAPGNEASVLPTYVLPTYVLPTYVLPTYVLPTYVLPTYVLPTYTYCILVNIELEQSLDEQT